MTRQAPQAEQDSATILATPEQLAAERRALKVLKDPRVQAAVAEVRRSLINDPAAARPEGLALLDRALGLWLHLLAMRVMGADVARPIVLMEANEARRSWSDVGFPPSGGAGINPDNIYRAAYIDGRHSYELYGQAFADGAGEFSIEGTIGGPADFVLTTAGKPNPDMGNQFALSRDSDIFRDEDGRFTITMDRSPANGRFNHIEIPEGPISLILRNTLSDWRQVPTTFGIRRVDTEEAGPPPSDEELALEIASKLAPWVAVWTTLKAKFLGFREDNKIVGPLPRDGGWGFFAGVHYRLEDDEALVVTTYHGGAEYTGVHLNDDWFAGSDPRHSFISLNINQAVRSPDGTVTYVIASSDPGFVNWLDTERTRSGFIHFRWQRTPPGLDPATLVRGCQRMKLADLNTFLPQGAVSIGAADRQRKLQQRADLYDRRFAR